jgi:crotonobetainyl-CoA:carnitine CoA-transferase CaiB-like acyl-CoA transferase
VGALDGLEVIEAGLLVQGPQAAATLRDWGADVVKVELPGFGDQSRWLPISAGDHRSAYFTACNRGKRSVTVDMRTPSGREVMLRLAEGADVLITNFKPGTMESWGLGYEQFAERNPRLVFAAGSTFGSRGPGAGREGADLSAQAAGGLIAGTGVEGGEPSPVAATIADHIAALNLVGGILAALHARERTGRGQRVDTSLLGGQIWAQASEYTGYLLSGRPHGRANRGNPLVPGGRRCAGEVLRSRRRP